jgi:hypothetical protein
VETAPSAVQPIAPEPAAAPTAIPVPQPIVPAKTQDAAPAAPAATAATPWAKAAGAAATPWAQRRGPVKPRATARLRKTIEGLPDWEPLPPGEIFVQRGRGDG